MANIDDLYLSLYDQDAENACIGAVLIDQDQRKSIPLEPDDFYSLVCKELWTAFRQMEMSKQAIDILTVGVWMEQHGKEVDTAFLAKCVGDIPSALNGEYYARIVADYATRRRVLREAQKLAHAAMDKENDIQTTVSEFAVSVPKMIRITDGAEPISELSSRHYDRMDARSRGEKTHRVLSGIEGFDHVTGGGRKGELFLILGKPGLGKTKWVVKMWRGMAEKGNVGVLYEMETDEEQIMDREFSRLCKIPTDRIENGKLTAEEWPIYTNEMEAAAALPLYADFRQGWTTSTLRADLARIKAEHGRLDFFVVDYLKFLGDKYGDGETERLNFISMQLKRLCRDLEVCGFVIHSMNKNGLNAVVPGLGDMSQGADIAFDCDRAMFMMEHVPDEGQPKHDDWVTFLFQKSRSQLKGNHFHMVAETEYPEFYDEKKPAPAARSRP